LQWIKTQALFEFQADFKALPNESRFKSAAGCFSGLAWIKYLFEGAFFIGGANA
jgi:hypothetical protein